MPDDIRLVDKNDDLTLQIIDRLRTLLATDPLTRDEFLKPIREYPPTGAVAGLPVVSLHSPDEDWEPESLGPVGIGSTETSVRMMLIITLNEDSKAKDADLIANYRKLQNVKGKFKRALIRYRADPTPGTDPSGVGRLWHKMKWVKSGGSGSDHSAMFFRVPESYLRVIIQFDLLSRQTNT